MTLDVSDTRQSPGRSRSWELDALRGLAIWLMVADHVALVLDGGDWYRLTLGRLAMPLFFILAGHLAGRPRWRHVGVGLLGVVLAVLVPWIDSPNVLTLWALGAVLLWWLRRLGASPWLLVLLALTASANGWAVSPGNSFDALSLWALMAVGALVPRDALTRLGRRVPWPLAFTGSRPVRWYVGHLLILQGVAALSGVVVAA